jgi:hypothetical protein
MCFSLLCLYFCQLSIISIDQKPLCPIQFENILIVLHFPKGKLKNNDDEAAISVDSD